MPALSLVSLAPLLAAVLLFSAPSRSLSNGGATTPPPHQGAPPLTSRGVGPIVPIFESSTPPYYCIRVPGAVRAPSGRILVFAEARRGSSCGDQDPKDVVLSTSTDDGASWTPLRRVVGTGAGVATYRNPYPVFTSTGALLLLFVNTTAAAWESLQVESLDEGATWSAPVSLAAQLGPWNGILGGPGSGVLLGAVARESPFAGRLVGCGATWYDGNSSLRDSSALLSSDGGAAWAPPAAPPGPFRGDLTECQVAELPNASVLVNFRREVPAACHCRAQSRSDDGGQTWSEPADVPALLEPVCAGGLVSLAGGSLYFSNPSSATARVNMTVSRSDDGGTTWPPDAAQVVWAGPAAYSVLVPPAAANASSPVVGIVFENGDAQPYERISFALVAL